MITIGRAWPRRIAALWLLIAVSSAAAGAALPPESDTDRAHSDPAGAPPGLMPDPLGPIPPDEPRNEAYAHGGYVLFFAGAFWSLAVLLFIVRSRLGARLQEIAGRIASGPNLRVAVFGILFTLVCFAATFPLEVYSGFVRERRYGFLNQGIGGWLGDQARVLAVGIVVQAVFLPLLYLLIRRLGRAWWAPGAALTVAFVVLVQAVFPVLIAPLFNTFKPLEDESLRRDILDLARSQGIPAGEVYQVDASRQSEHNNAYVAGILGTQRIVLYDTLLRRFSPREIRFVMGHEMGHYVLRHIWRTVAFISVLVVLGLLLADRVARRVIKARPSFGIGGIEEPASLPLLLLLLGGFLLLARPAISAYSQAQESAADRFGLDVVRDPEAAASSFLKFGRYDLSEHHVHPLIERILFTHPSGSRRIRMARDWAREHGWVIPPAGEAGRTR
jgi:STE24 endopeptidase